MLMKTKIKNSVKKPLFWNFTSPPLHLKKTKTLLWDHHLKLSTLFASLYLNNVSLVGQNYGWLSLCDSLHLWKNGVKQSKYGWLSLCECLHLWKNGVKQSINWFLLGFVIARHRLVKESVVFSLHITWSSKGSCGY